jgi:hypothetical protein
MNNKYLNTVPLEEQLKIIKETPGAIQSIKNPCLEIQLAAVKKHGFYIKYIENPSLEVQLEAVKQCGFAIEYICNPSLEVQLESIKHDSYSIVYIANPCLESLFLAYYSERAESVYDHFSFKELVVDKMKEYKKSKENKCSNI